MLNNKKNSPIAPYYKLLVFTYQCFLINFENATQMFPMFSWFYFLDLYFLFKIKVSPNFYLWEKLVISCQTTILPDQCSDNSHSNNAQLIL